MDLPPTIGILSTSAIVTKTLPALLDHFTVVGVASRDAARAQAFCDEHVRDNLALSPTPRAVGDDGDLSFDVDVEGESESESASYTYMNMELCDGGDLESYMRSCASSEAEAIAAAAAVDRSGGSPGKILLSALHSCRRVMLRLFVGLRSTLTRFTRRSSSIAPLAGHRWKGLPSC